MRIQILVALALAFGCLGATPVSPAPYPAAGFVRGVAFSSWDGSYRWRSAWEEDLAAFEKLGVTWLQVITFAHQPAVDAPTIEPEPDSKWPRDFVREARRRGFKILLKPHVWSHQFYDGSKRWRGSIAMPDDKTWEAWFAQYRLFILREARFAAEHGVEMLSVGLEYVEATKRAAAWRELIAEVRQVYPGLLTYAADGNHELGHIVFWDALDVIGVDAYFAVSQTASPGVEAMVKGWAPFAEKLGVLSGRYGKPIVFTEIGYPSYVGGATTPWRWPKGDETVDLQLQADAFEAAFRVCTAEPWCRGMFWWKWYEVDERVSKAHDYTPQGKPAEAVLRRWYSAPPVVQPAP